MGAARRVLMETGQDMTIGGFIYCPELEDISMERTF